MEFFPIDECPSRHGKNWELFSVHKNGADHLYTAGLRKELQLNHGVYLFYDSQGKAIYAGKAKAQTLWTEMNRVFNRPRRGPISRVEHPTVNVKYLTNEEKARPIIKRAVPLYDLARYFSAYRVDDGLINDVEAMLMRSFANDLTNKKMECFGRQQKGASASDDWPALSSPSVRWERT